MFKYAQKDSLANSLNRQVSDVLHCVGNRTKCWIKGGPHAGAGDQAGVTPRNNRGAKRGYMSEDGRSGEVRKRGIP